MKSRKGQTLVEVVIAIMISAMTATAVFSVVISSQYSNVKADKREAAAIALKAGAEYLKAYVSSVPGEASYVPNNGFLPGDNKWALRSGRHYMNFLVGKDVMPQLSGKSKDASMYYDVSDENCTGDMGSAPNYSGACKKVVFTLDFAAADE